MKLRDVTWAVVGLAAMLGSIAVIAWLNQPATAEVPSVAAVAGRDVDMRRVSADMTVLAQPASRLTGSAGERAARAHIIKELEALGVAEITQQAFQVAVPVMRRGVLMAEQAGRAAEPVPIYPLWPNMARTCQAPPGGLTGALVYVHGGSEAELRGVCLRGALVVLDWDSDLAWLSVPEFGGRAVIFRGARPASRTLAQRKYLTVPADIPRYYVAPEDVAALDALIASGGVARAECEVAWERVTGVNVLAKINDGEQQRGIRAIDREPVVFSAYYDSISIVPERAPGAEQACGAAALLELARQLRGQPGPRPVYVLFTSGHGQALAGITHFIEAVRAGACVRPGLIVSLDLSSHTSAYGVFAMGSFRPQIEMFVAPRYSTIGFKLMEIATGMAGPHTNAAGTAEDFIDGINNTSGRGWWTYFPYMAALESEMGTVAGIPSIALATVNDNRALLDTPDDTRGRQSMRLLARQITTRGGTQAGLLTLATALTHWRGSFVNRQLDDTWSTVAGRVAWLDQERDYTPNQPLADAMVFIKQQQAAKYFCGTRAMPALMTDADGRYRLSGLRRLIPFEFPPPFTLEAYAVAAPQWLAVHTNARARYQGMLGTNTAVAADGSIIFALDMARPDDYPWTFRPSSTERHVNVVAFPCKSVTLTGLTDPRSYVPLADMKVLEAATKSPPFQFGVSMSDLAGSDPSENIATIWTEPSLRVMLTGGIGFLGRRLILVNNTPGAPEGRGFVLAELTTLPSMVLQCARDMWNITAARIKKLGQHGVSNPRVTGHHDEAAGWLRAADDALARYDYAVYRTAAERGWAAAGQAYAETLAMVNNMIHGVLFYLFLLLPLAYCLERLLIASHTIQRRIIWIGVLFAGSFGVLALVHPAFRFTLTPFLVLLAFVIVAMVTTVAVLLIGRVDGLLQARKQAAGGRHDEQYRRGGVAVRALDLGMSNIRRRPQRGFLTGLSVVVVTFILLSFTSLVPTVSISRLTHPRGVAAYVGLLSRDRAWNPLPEPLCDALRRSYGNVTNAAVAVRAWFYSDMAGQFSVIDLSADATGRRTTVSALACFEPAEAQITGVTNALLAGRWFRARDEDGIILSCHTAAQLGLTTNDLGTRIRLYSKDMPLLGIMDAKAFDRMPDLDGEPLTPVNMVMQRAMRAQRVQGGQGGEQSDTLEDYVHYSMDQIAIAPLWFSAEVRGAARSVAVRLPPGADADDEAAGYARRSNLTILGSDGGRVTLYAALNTSQLSAAWQIAIPMLLAGIMILATMMGSVFERRGEINVYNSVGLSPGTVGMLFVAESAVYAIVGAGMGYLLGQAAAKLLHVTGWLGGLTLNYSAGGTMFVTLASMLMVLLSAIYPARQAFHAAMPDLEKEQDATAMQAGQVHDALCIWLPFVATPGHIYAMQAYLYEFLDSVQGITIGTLAVDHLAAKTNTFNGKPAPALAFRAWLSPFDLGVSHDAELTILWREEHGVYQYHLSAERYSGDRQNWRRLTPRFVNTLRKQLLMWRILTPEEQQRYDAAGRRMFASEAVLA